ncbi:MocR-like pyridoxine biosynthesis transcription factor PdxR [Pseudonocardia humida]|uniref:PLP-dependent aminotransferase family protein n=1 Tax=Pseudonocardia humida TaxID=2800819 RepID=A0ABT1A4V0_9PSEU|nr:PLP-dependent aminotransferase family protein [Pseudonocardia humida]MCO1658029.1 PLP-dependent aminotransferase family protein [Pseudonocardia humida]
MGISGTNSGRHGELPIVLDRAAGESLHRQVGAAIRASVRSGRLAVGTRLPPTRTMAADLGVSRGVVVEAYQQLIAEGYLTGGAGGYTTVAGRPRDAASGSARALDPPAPAARVDFGYGRADVANFPRAAWLRSIRRALVETPGDRFLYSTGRGAVEVRTALAEYLDRVRGTAADPENVLICNGFAQAVALLVGVAARRGARRMAVEDPSSDDDARPIAAAAGLEVVGIPVGPDGIDVAALERSDADLVILTPSHQWPTGGVLPAHARAAVLSWAERRGALVVEDDYDAEYRYDRQPVGAMQGLAPQRVVYAGTASKTLAPGMRLGWLVLPRDLVDDVAAAKVLADRGSAALEQLAFADFLDRGEFDRHLRRLRPVYRRRRDALLAALAERLPELEPAGVAAGLHLVAWLPPDLDEASVVAAAARRGLVVNGVTPFRLSSRGPGGLIFGYSSLNERAIDEGVRLLAAAVADVR